MCFPIPLSLELPIPVRLFDLFPDKIYYFVTYYLINIDFNVFTVPMKAGIFSVLLAIVPRVLGIVNA